MSEGTLFLFAPELGGHRLTREEAGISPSATVWEQVKQYVYACKSEGATRPEIEQALGLNPNTISPTLWKLEGCPDRRTGKPRYMSRRWIDKTGRSRDGAAVYIAHEP